MTTTSQTPGSPAEFDALFALAKREVITGRLAAAAAAYRKILALRPDIAEAYNDLGNVLLDQGNLEEAAAQFERAVALQPGVFRAHNNLGAVLAAQGKLDQAVASFSRALAINPNFPDAYNNLGAALRIQGKLDQALASLQQAIALNPDYAEACYNLGNVLKDQDKLDEAAAQYGRAVTLNPGLFQAHNNLGAVLQTQGKLDQAMARLGQAIALKPDYPEAHNNLGKVLDEEGKFDQATARFEQALALRPDFAEAHYNRSNLKAFSPHDPDLASLEAIASDAGRLPPDKMVYIHFALGKALEDVGDYPRAFEHWLQGNALKHREINYDEVGFQRTCRLVADAFDASLFDRFSAAGDPSSAPIFVLGMPRSGSTLIEQVLASHPQVHATGELKNLERVVNSVGDSTGLPVPYPVWICALDSNILRRLGNAYLASLPTPAGGKTRIIDKAPSNFLRVGLIRLILPNAKIIHTMRDPADTCVSCFSRLFNDLPFSYDLAELGRYYRWYHELMAHWRSVLPAGAMLDVSYEDVVDDLEQQARRLIDFCGLPWDDRCLRFHETSRPIATSSNVQVRRPIYRSSLARWRRFEAYLDPLLAELKGCR